MNTFERVRSIVGSILNRCEEQVLPEASLKNDLGADSIDIVDITMALEEAFCIEFGEDAMELTSVQQIVDYIDARSGEQH